MRRSRATMSPTASVNGRESRGGHAHDRIRSVVVENPSAQRPRHSPVDELVDPLAQMCLDFVTYAGADAAHPEAIENRHDGQARRMARAMPASIRSKLETFCSSWLRPAAVMR